MNLLEIFRYIYPEMALQLKCNESTKRCSHLTFKLASPLTYAMYPWYGHCEWALMQKERQIFNYLHFRDTKFLAALLLVKSPLKVLFLEKTTNGIMWSLRCSLWIHSKDHFTNELKSAILFYQCRSQLTCASERYIKCIHLCRREAHTLHTIKS